VPNKRRRRLSLSISASVNGNHPTSPHGFLTRARLLTSPSTSQSTHRVIRQLNHATAYVIASHALTDRSRDSSSIAVARGSVVITLITHALSACPRLILKCT